MRNQSELVIEKLTKTFYAGNRRINALEEIDFKVKSGELINLIGPSGCGKSTLLRCIAGFEKPTKGRIKLNGQQIDAPGVERMMVFQSFDQLFPWFTVLENIIFALKVTKTAEKKKERKEIAHVYLEMVGLTSFASLYPHQLSGGMKQRVAIARALSVRPQLLLMDEPFGSLDAMTRLTLQEELIRIWEETKVTILFVTHNIEEAIILGDRIVVLGSDPGRIKAVITNKLARPRSPEGQEYKLIYEELYSLLGFAHPERARAEKNVTPLFTDERELSFLPHL
jgi:NitT/TauT family transport system ATP-binding protein